MGSWGCPHEIDGLCDKLGGAYCRPGMRGCVLAGKVEFPGGKIPAPVWPRGHGPTVRDRTPGERD